MPKQLAKEPTIKWLGKGNVVANCTRFKCPHGMQPLDQFVPVVSQITHKKRSTFLKIVKAIEAIDDVLADPECMKMLNKVGLLRMKGCLHCRLIGNKAHANPKTKHGACRAKWYALKADAEKLGCAECGCNDAISFEHTDPSTKIVDDKGRTFGLAEISKWTKHGPEAMQAERNKCIVLCRNCHCMQSTNLAMQEKIDPSLLPDARYRVESAAYLKKYQLVELRKKQEYVDAKKFGIGGCAVCQMRVVPSASDWWPAHTGWPHVFQFAHRSELDKEDGVANIVTRRISFKTAKPLLDREMERCRLLCMCCGQVETDARATEPGPSEEGN
jgi:hypothetical protein